MNDHEFIYKVVVNTQERISDESVIESHGKNLMSTSTLSLMQGTFLGQKCRLCGTTHCNTGIHRNQCLSRLLNFAPVASCTKQLNIFRQQNIKEMTIHLHWL